MASFLGPSAIAGVKSYDLSQPLQIGMPQSPNHPAFWRSMPRRHGDRVREDGGSAANDLISMGTHVGTHIDALSHVSQDGRLHGGIDAEAAQRGGSFAQLSVFDIPPILARGLLLDIPAALGVACCEPAMEVTPEHLEAALKRQQVEPRPGDVLLVRTGWAQRWGEGAAYVGHRTGVPGVAEAGAQWLAGHRPTAVGADTLAFERIPAGTGHARLPAHRVLLVEHGVPIIESLNLEELAAAAISEFTLIAIPMPLVGATGSPIRPLALVSPDD